MVLKNNIALITYKIKMAKLLMILKQTVKKK